MRDRRYGPSETFWSLTASSLGKTPDARPQGLPLSAWPAIRQSVVKQTPCTNGNVRPCPPPSVREQPSAWPRAFRPDGFRPMPVLQRKWGVGMHSTLESRQHQSAKYPAKVERIQIRYPLAVACAIVEYREHQGEILLCIQRTEVG